MDIFVVLQKQLALWCNEISAVQELLKKTDIEGCLIVADVLNYQQKNCGGNCQREG